MESGKEKNFVWFFIIIWRRKNRKNKNGKKIEKSKQKNNLVFFCSLGDVRNTNLFATEKRELCCDSLFFFFGFVIFFVSILCWTTPTTSCCCFFFLLLFVVLTSALFPHIASAMFSFLLFPQNCFFHCFATSVVDVWLSGWTFFFACMFRSHIRKHTPLPNPFCKSPPTLGPIHTLNNLLYNLNQVHSTWAVLIHKPQQKRVKSKKILTTPKERLWFSSSSLQLVCLWWICQAWV